LAAAAAAACNSDAADGDRSGFALSDDNCGDADVDDARTLPG
jgi:hypothetical protein